MSNTIDDSEVHNLRQLMGEVFGEENFVAHIVWQKRYVSNVTARLISDMHDHILVYAHTSEAMTMHKLSRTDEQLLAYKNPDNDPRGPWRAQDLSASKPYAAGRYTIITPSGLKVNPPPGRYWRCSAPQYNAWLSDNRIWFGTSGEGRPMLKAFLSESQDGVTPNTWWDHHFAGHNKEATLEIKDLFDGSSPLDTPKPVKLLRRMLELSTGPDSLVMDFFAGSGTTAHAVLALNREDSGNRHFIMVQIPEPTPKDSVARVSGFATIAEIGKERIRRVIARMQQENSGKLDLSTRETPEDLGFRVYKLARSHFKAWQPYQGESTAAVQDLFNRAESPLVEGWRPEGLRVEIMLQEGFALDSSVARQGEFRRNAVDCVSSEFCEHRLFICLDQSIAKETVDALPAALRDRDIFVCLDQALTDESKLRLSDKCNLHVI